jgi:YggT family protein
MGLILCRLVQAYFFVLLGRVVLSWFPITPNTTLASVYSVLYSLTEPILGPLRRVLPPIGMGGMGLDLSPLIVFFAVALLQQAVCSAV